MYRLKKLHPPFGSTDMPVYEGSYSEGLIPVIDGNCTVKLQETRDRLLKMGYADVQEDEQAVPHKSRKRR